MTPAEIELQQRRFLARWWWLCEDHAKDKCEAALAWETLRRTRFYPELWQTFARQTAPLLRDAAKPSLAGVFQQGHLIQTAREAVGQPYFDFLMGGFDPGLTWLELEKGQRLRARGFVLGEREVLKVNGEYLLPRQQADLPAVGFSVVELGRDKAGHVVVSKQICHEYPFDRLGHLDFFRGLPLQPGRYVSVLFDTRGARDALLEAFDGALRRWVGDWRAAMKDSGRFGILWGGEDRKPVEFWAPEFGSEIVRAKRNEMALIPSDDPGSAILLVSARHNPETLRASFHTHLKMARFKVWHSRCVEYWKTVTVETLELVRNPDGTTAGDENGRPLRRPVRRHVFHPERDLPPKAKAVRSARRADLWLGLAADDVVAAGLALGKGSAEGAFLYGLCKDYAALKNPQRSAALRLRELDQGAEALREALARQSEENARLAKLGCFAAAAGEQGPPGSA